MIAALGVDIATLYTIVFALGAALAGLAGALVGTIQSVQVGMGEPVLILAFVIVVIGGIGSIKGALVGALLVGMTDTLGKFAAAGLLRPLHGGVRRDLGRLGARLDADLRPDGAGPGLAADRALRICAHDPERHAVRMRSCSPSSWPWRLRPMPPANPFIVTLATKVAILALAGVGLNLALGYGGLVSFGHAAFFGIGGYVTGILASHAASATPVATFPFTMMGTNEMLVIWPVAILASGLAALAIGALCLRTTGVYFIMITLAFAQMLYYFAISWPAYGGEDGLSVLRPQRLSRRSTPSRRSQFFAHLLRRCLAGDGPRRRPRRSRASAWRSGPRGRTRRASSAVGHPALRASGSPPSSSRA